MSETSFVIALDETQENRYRHWHRFHRGEITEFLIQYEALIAGHWHPIVRYDTAHGIAHRDLCHPNGTQTKEFFSGHYSNADIMTAGQRDILENWSMYRAAFEEEMRL